MVRRRGRAGKRRQACGQDASGSPGCQPGAAGSLPGASFLREAQPGVWEQWFALRTNWVLWQAAKGNRLAACAPRRIRFAHVSRCLSGSLRE